MRCGFSASCCSTLVVRAGRVGDVEPALARRSRRRSADRPAAARRRARPRSRRARSASGRTAGHRPARAGTRARRGLPTRSRSSALRTQPSTSWSRSSAGTRARAAISLRGFGDIVHGIITRLLSIDDLDAALGLSTAAGWNQRLDDWRMLLRQAPAGSFAAITDGRLVGTAIGIDYGGFGWIAMMLVDPAHRGRGVGRCLLEAAMDALPSDRPIRLDATPMGRPLYQRYGFEDEAMLTRHLISDATSRGETSPVRPLTAADLQIVTERGRRRIWRQSRHGAGMGSGQWPAVWPCGAKRYRAGALLSGPRGPALRSNRTSSCWQ